MRQRLQNFMYGRYGSDQLTRFLLGLYWVLAILSLFMKRGTYRFFSTLATVVIIWCIFRVLSRNIAARSEENRKYLIIRSKVMPELENLKNMFLQRRYYRFYRCPECKVMTRVPRGHGKIKIRCPKCGNEFVRKS